MKVEFPKKSHKKRRNIFNDRLEKQLDDILREFYSSSKIRLDGKSIQNLKAALKIDAIDVIVDTSNISDMTSDEYLQAIINRAIAIIDQNGLEVLPEFDL